MTDQETLFPDAFPEPETVLKTEPPVENNRRAAPTTKTEVHSPNNQQWTRLYSLAVALRELAPWQWMVETQVFGVEHPETHELGFVSIMGTRGEHLSAAIYLGPKALYDFLQIQETGEDPMAIFDVPQLQVSFEDRDRLEAEDRRNIKELGLKFRGRQQYPIFRSFEPGYMPWFVDTEEAQFLTYAIEQVLDVAPRVRVEPDLVIDGYDPDAQFFLVRVADASGDTWVWHDEVRRIPPPTVQFPTPSPIAARTDEFKAMDRQPQMTFQIDHFYVPAPIGEPGARPYFPKALLIVDAESGFILGTELMRPYNTEAETDAALADGLIRALSQSPFLPGEIQVGTDRLFRLFREFTQKLNIKLRQTNELPALAEAKEGLIRHFGGF